MALEESLISTKYLEPAVWILVAWLVKELFSNYNKRHEKQDSATDRNTVAILTLEKSLIELQGQLKLLSQQMQPFARLPDDVAKAHAKIRKLEESM